MEANGDAASVEAQIVISKTNKNKFGKTKELLTVAEMKKRGFPEEKIKAIVARGGVPDEDVPHLTELYKYWVQTSCTLKESEEIKQEGTIKAAGAVSAGAVDALMSGPSTGSQVALPQGGLEQVMQSLSQQQGALLVKQLGFGVFILHVTHRLSLQIYLDIIMLIKRCVFPAGPNPKPKAKAKVKARAKAKSAPGQGVSEIEPKTLDDLKAELSVCLKYMVLLSFFQQMETPICTFHVILFA